MSKAIKSLKYYNLEQSVARATKLFRFGKQINLTIVTGGDNSNKGCLGSPMNNFPHKCLTSQNCFNN